MSNNELYHETIEVPVTPAEAVTPEKSMNNQLIAQVLEQVSYINAQIEHLHQAFNAVAEVADTDYAVEQTESVVKMIEQRELTNRKALSLLESLLDSNKPSNQKTGLINNLIENNHSGQNNDLIREIMQDL